MTAPLLIFAVGNQSRGDDALGPLLLQRLTGRFGDKAELLEDFQLQIEHSMDMAGRRLVLFVDAGMDTPAPFSFYRTQADPGAQLYSHALTPEALLKVYQQFHAQVPPDSFVLCIRGESFELGEPLSQPAQEHLAAALEFMDKLLSDASPPTWDALSDSRP